MFKKIKSKILYILWSLLPNLSNKIWSIGLNLILKIKFFFSDFFSLFLPFLKNIKFFFTD